METRCALFDVGAQYLNIIQMKFVLQMRSYIMEV